MAGVGCACRDYRQVGQMTVLTAAQQNEPVLPSLQARLACRAGMSATTAGVANGFVQGNLAILPEKLAASFHRFCQLNPKPCPIIGMSDVGDPRIPALGLDLDIRTDVPRYRVWRDGEVVDEPTDIMAHWRDDLVAFVVSLRPFTPAHAIRALQIPARLPSVHGAPAHLGLPHLIGIQDIAKPDYGDPVPLASDEIPVFWACGVTPQAVIAN